MLKKEKSRWICSFKSCPSVLMTMNKICFASDYGQPKKMQSEPESVGGNAEDIKLKSNDSYLCECSATVLYRNKKRHEITPKHKSSM